jgi:hypothetical protein
MDITKKKDFRNIIIASVLTVFYAASASANLIVNGGFEDVPKTSLGGGGGWKYYNSNNVSGWSGSNIELWGTHGIKSYEGPYHAELNANGQNTGEWSIAQIFSTIEGQSYDLFFAYGARLGNSNESNESFEFTVDGLSSVQTEHVVGKWSEYTGRFVADGDTATLRFTSVFEDIYTYGNFIDDVKVSAVPEPRSLALLVLCLLGLSAVRRKVA